MEYLMENGLPIAICKDEYNLKDIILSKADAASNKNKSDAFFLCDLGCVVNQYLKWYRELPCVEPFYAAKCNMDANVLYLLAKLGIGFDCASEGEIQTVLNLGVPSEKIIYANPCKQASHISFAEAHGVSMMTFDNEAELDKIKEIYPNAKLVIRIRVDDSKSLCKFGMKFGVDIECSKDLLQYAKDLGMDVIGVSFHVGSRCCDAALYFDSLRLSRIVFDQARGVGYNFTLLDIGGGFPGDDEAMISFEEAADALRKGFQAFFPHSYAPNLRIIAEPGRYFVATAFTSACNITSKRVITSNEPGTPKMKNIEGFMYYLNDGAYGSFSCIFNGSCEPEAQVLSSPDGSSRLFKCSLWGPTCDGQDCINKEIMLPKLDIGHWLYFVNMGAYTTSASTGFNGFTRPSVHYIISEENWRIVLGKIKKNVPGVTNLNTNGHISDKAERKIM